MLRIICNKMKIIQENKINVCANKSKRTFTIRTNGFKYRTIQMSKEEYRSLLSNTANDWRYFLHSCSGDYYKV